MVEQAHFVIYDTELKAYLFKGLRYAWTVNQAHWFDTLVEAQASVTLETEVVKKISSIGTIMEEY